MNSKTFSVFLFLATFLGVVLLSPQIAEAKVAKKKISRCHKGFCVASVSITKGADEKNFSDPTTRCLTADMKSRHAQAVSQMQKDIAAHGQGHEQVAKTYQDKLDILWSAMQQPYCGYGSYGLTAVKHSWDKTVNNARTAFLEAVGAMHLARN